MSLSVEYKNRQVIPRWNPIIISCLLGETQSIQHPRPQIEVNVYYHEKKRIDWEKNKKYIYALDFIASALLHNILDDANVKDAINYLKNHYDILSFSGQHLVNYIISRNKNVAVFQPDEQFLIDCNSIYGIIAGLKGDVRKYSLDAFAWLDLAFYYTTLDQYDKAEKCVIIALELNRTNRLILRSAARFYLHIGKPEKAVHILRNAVSIQEDPWLVSAEIAVSEIQGLKSRFIKTGIHMLDSQMFNSRSTTELNASLATLEYAHGNVRKAKKFLRDVLIAPNENSLAQAEYLAKKMMVDVNPMSFKIPFKYEALLWEEFKKGKFSDALKNAVHWMIYQPFSSRPVTTATYISAVALFDDNAAIKLVENACPSAQKDPKVMNNYAFSLANIGEIQKAKNILHKIAITELDEYNRAVITATRGLIAFRTGAVEEGRELYMKAISFFTSQDEFSALARAYLFLGREELRINNNEATKYLQKALELAKNLGLHDVINYVKHLLV